MKIFCLCRKSRSVVKNNRTILYIADDMIGHLYGHVTLTIWKLSKKRLSEEILKERTRGGKKIVALLA